jgi:hypothetical protein
VSKYRYLSYHTDDQAMKHIQTIINLSKEGEAPPSDESSLDAPPTPSDAETDSSLKSVLSAPVGDAPAAPNRDHPADILAPPKEALFKTRAWPDEALEYMLCRQPAKGERYSTQSTDFCNAHYWVQGGCSTLYRPRFTVEEGWTYYCDYHA